LSKLGVNRRIRKRWQREGVIVHPYAGPDEGYTLGRALKESGGDPTQLYELDIVRGRADDMMADDAKYAALLRMAMDGWIDGVVGGPNCRTASDINLSGLQWQKVFEDDVMLLRMIVLYVVAQMGRDVTLRNNTTKALKPHVAFLIEQPAISERYPECASFWKLECWQTMKFFYHFKEYTPSCRATLGALRGNQQLWEPTWN